MSRNLLRMLPVLTVAAALAAHAGCRNTPVGHPAQPEPPAGVEPTVLDYVDSDAFDGLFESVLVLQDPVILIRTGDTKPEWSGRLNAWIAAWNMGGKVEGRTVRGQAPLPKVGIDGEGVRELRLLVNDLMDRVEELAKHRSTWLAEERLRARRVALLRAYNLRFHIGEDATIQLVFFNGKYAPLYPGFVETLTRGGGREEGWSRTVECSLCKAHRGTGDAKGRLTGRRSGPPAPSPVAN